MRSSICLGLSLLAIGMFAACSSDDDDDTTDGNGDDGNVSSFYQRTDLLSDLQDEAPQLDVNLVNPWGIAFGDDTVFWIANQGSETATVCDAEGQPVNESTITVPDGPTGVVYNEDEESFTVSDGVVSASSEFIFATVAGTIYGWNGDIDPLNAMLAVDSSAAEASYTGLAMADSDAGSLVYAADFHNARIDAFDGDFAPVDLGVDAFVDPDLPDGYAPFGIHNIDGMLYVTFAQQDEAAEEEVEGPGLGFVDVFAPDGTFDHRLASQGELNAPWGVALAPDEFGEFGGALLIGNLGDGHITAVDPDSYDVLGQLQDADGAPIEVEGLWAIVFGNGLDAGDPNALYFTGGIEEETHGVFGRIDAVEE